MRKWMRGVATAPALGLIILGALSLLSRASTLHGGDGVVWLDSAAGPRAARVLAGSPADRAGIRAGDRLLGIEESAPANAESIRNLLWSRAGQATRYRLQRDPHHRPVEIDVVPWAEGDDNRLFYFLFVVGLAALAAGCLAWLKLPSEPAVGIYYLFSLALFSLLSLSPAGNGGFLDWVFYWGDLCGRLLAAPLLIHFLLRISDPPADSGRKARVWLYAPAFLLMGLAVGLVGWRWALQFRDPARIIHIKDRLELICLGIYALAAAALLAWRYWTCLRPSVRWKLRWVATCVGAGLLPLSLLYLLPSGLGMFPGALGELSILPLMITPLGLAATLFQGRTVDLDGSLRSFVRGAVAGGIFLSGGAACSWALSVVRGPAPAGAWWEMVFPLLISAALAVFFHRFLGQGLDRLLGRRMAGLPRTVLAAGEDIQGETRLESLTGKLASRIESDLGISRVLFLIEAGADGTMLPAGGRGWEPPSGMVASLSRREIRALSAQEILMLAIADAQLPAAFRRLHREAGFQYLFPLAVKGSARGFLLCGARRDGAPLGGEDLDTLAALAAQAAGGIEATRLRREIEERNHREKRLRREADAILQSARMGILLTDATGVITAANSAAEELVECADLLGLAIERVLPEDLLERLNGANQAGCAEERQGKGASVLRYVLERHGGEGRVVNARRSFLEGNELSGSVYALDDISEEVRREEKMVRQDHLAAVGLLASQVAHEVNTPLSGIASYAQILMDRMKSRVPEMELLKKIEAQAFRAAGIAGSVLNFTRRKEEAPAEEFDPGPVIAESLALFEPNLKGKRIRFSMERAPSLPAIRGHRGQVQQVVLNLLLNAAQALPAGGEIRLCLDRDGEAIRIRVSDTGVGIPARHLSRIFEPFYSVRTDGSGTGLGLSVVQKIVKEHGGSIQVESVEGSGSTFTVFLPACPVREKELAHGA